MDPDRWRAISLHLEEMLDLADGERALRLATLREQDPALAEEVGVLLDEHDAVRREQFLEQDDAFGLRPATGEAATAVNAFAGRVFGAYKLLTPIGEGGMGRVWLGERCDGAFEQRAAVKLLDILRFNRSEARFRREANLLARVTHPNIAHLIDAGVSPQGQPYLVLEFVDGQEIDRYCDDRALDVRQRIQLIVEVLRALAHAHSQRVVHRDIKPSNVLVRTDGHVKLLDFGIAKLLQPDDEGGFASTLTLEHGGALTPAYAAPEQVAGRPVTPATDVYAVGVLLYTLLTGQHPCGDASSPADLLKAIVDVDSRPPSIVVTSGKPAAELATLAERRRTTPGELQRTLKGDLDTIIAKALRKDPGERYGSADDLSDDLRRYLASEPIHARGDSFVRRTSRFARRHRAAIAPGVVGALAMIALMAFYTSRSTGVRAPSLAPGQDAPTPITSETGEEEWPSLSPDGTRLAFSWLPRGESGARIAVKTIGSDALVQLTDGTARDGTPVWSPDGQHLAFLRSFRKPDPRWEICLVPVAGGTPRVLLEGRGLSSPSIAWWEAENALLYSRTNPGSGAFQLAALNLATLQVTPLTNPPAPRHLAGPGDFFPAFSADGRTVAFVRETDEGRDIFLMDLTSRRERRLTRDHRRIAGITWSPDGESVIMASPRSGTLALYRVDLRDGAIERLSHAMDGARAPMVRGGRLVFSQSQDDSNIYRVNLRAGRAAGPAQLLIGSSRADNAPHISPDGRRIAFLSTRGGGMEIWVASADGRDQRRLTSLPITSGPIWSPDGQSIAFGALGPGVARPDIWIIDAQGRNQRQITTAPSYETMLAWSADGRSVYFRSDQSGRFEVWSAPAAGGAATQVTRNVGLRAQESRDGRFLYYANDIPEVWRRPLRDHSPEELVARFPEGTHWGGNWVVGERGLYYLDEQQAGRASIEYLPFGFSGQAHRIRVASLTAPPTFAVTVFAVAPDESWLVWAQDDYHNSDIMMLDIGNRR